MVAAALRDAGIASDRVDGLLLGNSTAGGNPARSVALAAGLPERSSATTIDSGGVAGLEAIVIAAQRIEAGDASILLAGGAESLSTAPWRVARPKNPHQVPRFIGAGPGSDAADGTDEGHAFDGSEALARQLNITREAQDAYAIKSHLRAEIARENRRFLAEIQSIRANADEARDQSSAAPSVSDLARLTPFLPSDGTLTPGNTSNLADGAACAVLVSHGVWQELGCPPGLILLRSAIIGVPPESEARAAVVAVEALLGRMPRYQPASIHAIEMSEASAAEALALVRLLGFDDSMLNSDGGALVRGHPIAAASAISVARLFTRLIRSPDRAMPQSGPARLGLVAQTATGGLGMAALFQATS